VTVGQTSGCTVCVKFLAASQKPPLDRRRNNAPKDNGDSAPERYRYSETRIYRWHDGTLSYGGAAPRFC
jgi:hypothetical protein